MTGQGYRFKVRAGAETRQSTLIAAKAGSYNRLGYILTHSAIVIICIGGLIDGNVPLKVQELLGYKKIETRDLPVDQVPALSRLSPANLSFRGSISIPEGGAANVVYLNRGGRLSGAGFALPHPPQEIPYRTLRYRSAEIF